MEDGRYSGESSLGKGRHGSSRNKGKKSTSDKPKQPQRGLGVAQLEKIRLSSQMGCSYIPPFPNPSPTNIQEGDQRMEMKFPSSASPASYLSNSLFDYHPGIMMGFGDMDRRDTRREDSLSSVTTRWNDNSILQSPNCMQSNVTRPFFSLPTEDLAQKKRRQDRCDSVGSSSQNSEAGEAQEVDLDLKLSL